jgi:protocatechuate 3,4-dioxygenase beta subunit
MKNKDERIGYFLSRRETMVLFGVTGASWLLSRRPTAAQTFISMSGSLCIARPEQTEGPYFVDERLHRTDIRSDPADGQIRPGAPLSLTFQVMRLHSGKCRPLPDAQVDVWHCDAAGIYSNVRDPGFNTVGQKFLRGYQMTNARGEARFMTIYPGWYPIRTVHIHFKIRTALVSGTRFEFTSQLYFPDKLTDRVHTGHPYTEMGPRRVRNRQDFIFPHGGNALMLDPSPMNDGYAAAFPIGLEIP